MEDSDSSISCVSDFMIATNKYNKGHTHQASFEEKIGFDGEGIHTFIICGLTGIQEVNIIVGSVHCSCFSITSLKKFDSP